MVWFISSEFYLKNSINCFHPIKGTRDCFEGPKWRCPHYDLKYLSSSNVLYRTSHSLDASSLSDTSSEPSQVVMGSGDALFYEIQFLTLKRIANHHFLGAVVGHREILSYHLQITL